jgi:hypothetical protein
MLERIWRCFRRSSRFLALAEGDPPLQKVYVLPEADSPGIAEKDVG